MASRGSGLRNRFRNGKGPYHKRRKSEVADRYGKYDNGKVVYPDRLAKWVQPGS